MQQKLVRFLEKSGIVTWILLVILWSVAAHFTSPDFLPGPLRTLSGLGELIRTGRLAEDLRISLWRILVGWCRAILIAVPVGLLIGRFRIARWLLEPLLNFFRFIPAIGFITLFLMWFGVGEASKLVLITYAAMFPIMINTIAGVSGIDEIKYQVAESLGASKLQSFLTVTIPGAVPGIFTGIRLGLSGSIIAIVGAEMVAAQSGIGYLIYTSRLYYRTDWIFVGIVTLGLLGFCADRLLRVVGNRLFRYYGIRNQ